MRASKTGEIEARLTPEQRDAVDAKLAWAEEADLARRVWAGDFTLWGKEPKEITDRMGWLLIVDRMLAEIEQLEEFAQAVRDDGFTHCVLLGMGGSSLAPEVMRQTFKARAGSLQLHVLDSTHPDAVAGLADKLPLDQTLFLVSSKSGTTLETLSFYKYFRSLADDASRFVAITDPGSPLAKLAEREGFRRTFPNHPEIGGRYSALSYFGLVPAALIGVDLKALLQRAWDAERSCKDPLEGGQDPGLQLGLAIGELARLGRDKLTLVASSPITSFGLWVEQLVAESSGKQGRGIVPVVDETLGGPEVYAEDRVFVYLRNRTDPDLANEQLLSELAEAGHPVITVSIAEAADLGAQFFLWEFAVAVACSVIGVNAFDQPNVQEAKDLTGKVIEEYLRGGQFPQEKPSATIDSIAVYDGAEDVTGALAGLLSQVKDGKYVAFMLYAPPDEEVERRLGELRVALRDKLRVATTFGYGPRFLHSTGQLHKGGPPIGVFVQIRSGGRSGVDIPASGYDFEMLIKAQAEGDLEALRSRNLPVLRIDISGDLLEGLGKLADLLGKASVAGIETAAA